MPMSIDPIPYATPVGATQLRRNRRGGLIAFGVLSILIGSLPALFASLGLFVIFRMLAAPPRVTRAIPYFLIATFVNGFLGTLFIWAGVASIRRRRWVRPIVIAI